MKNEKVTQLQEKVANYFNDEIRNDFHIPYSRINATIEAVLDNTNLRNNHIDYSLIELMKVVLFTSSILTHMEIEYELPYFEKDEYETDETVNWYLAYDELYPIWVTIRSFGNVYEIENILDKEIELAEKRYLQLGLIEEKIVSSVERITTVLEDVNRTIKDKKKFGEILKAINKNFPQLGELIKK